MSWKDELYKYDMTVAEDLDTLANRSTAAKTNDVGFVNPISGAGVMGKENGDLEGFADYGLGFRFSRKKQSLFVYAPHIHLFTKGITQHDNVNQRSYFRDEHKDVDELLKNIK